MTTASTDVI